MQYRYAVRDGVAPIALPTTAKFAQDASSLDEKRAAQLEWMRKRGITIRLKESERPRPEEKAPLPGTVIYFSSSS